jgi:hypothetical protein
MASRISQSSSKRGPRGTGGSRRIGTAIAGKVSLRTRIIWGSLVAAMTVVGGTLFLVDRSPASRVDGFSLPALMATTGGTSNFNDIYATTRKPLDTKRWTSVVVHHSGSPVGTLASLDAEARRQNLKGVGYHFVIGNGSGIDDGEVVVTQRWMDQINGAHVGGKYGDQYNLSSIGICLVGDGNRKAPTESQMRALEMLVSSLSKQLHISRDNIKLHSQLAATSDPGRLFPEASFRERINGIR